MRPRFLLDEHLKHAIQEQLPEMHVRLIGDEDAPPLGTPDPDILVWIEHNNYILITNNRTTMPSHLTEHLQVGRHVPEFFVSHRGPQLGLTSKSCVGFGTLSRLNNIKMLYYIFQKKRGKEWNCKTTSTSTAKSTYASKDIVLLFNTY